MLADDCSARANRHHTDLARAVCEVDNRYVPEFVSAVEKRSANLVRNRGCDQVNARSSWRKMPSGSRKAARLDRVQSTGVNPRARLSRTAAADPLAAPGGLLAALLEIPTGIPVLLARRAPGSLRSRRPRRVN
jgi:hypothetical protein